MTIYIKEPWRTLFPIWNQSVPCPVLTVASWPVHRFLRGHVRWSGIPISLRIFQFVVIHTVKGCMSRYRMGIHHSDSCQHSDSNGDSKFTILTAFIHSQQNKGQGDDHSLVPQSVSDADRTWSTEGIPETLTRESVSDTDSRSPFSFPDRSSG